MHAQEKGLEYIDARDLKMHMQFLASDELKGRDTGEPGLEIAARYLAVQARALGLTPADPENGFQQHYIIEEKAYDKENSHITITDSGIGSVINTDPFYIFSGGSDSQIIIEGEVVFAGYGINDEEHHYNDYENIDIIDKVVLIMNRAPMNEEGTEAQFDHDKWTSRRSFQYKMQYVYSQQPKAVLMVLDPKSGFHSFEEISPGMANFLSRSRNLKDFENIRRRPGRGPGGGPKTVFIHRSVADQLLEGTGKNLKDLQLEIDRNLMPQSFSLEGKSVHVVMNMKVTDMVVSNVFGLIEGSDPVLKEEVVIYLAHYDHVGTDGKGGVFNGADDNASGTVALIEIAEAYMSEKNRPARSIGILWVSAEEVGLYGSRYFAEYPLVPTEKIAAVINLDMIGRTKTEEDVKSTKRDLTIVGGDTVKVIGGLQSKVLMEINNQTLEEHGLVGIYTYNKL
ncbi:MAG: M20/M25/M40 family metallo-hydrolase, partial [Bacteroidales bacterium]|nr:M20/M25/M40 family metallo-hydrolase [Bacteroidales bacterium]